MARSALKCEKNEKLNKEKAKKAMLQNNMDGARIYGQNAIREKTTALNCLRISSRIDGVASRLESAIRMKQVTSSMTGVVKGMGKAMKSMDVEKISKTMDEFEKQFEDMDVISGAMEGAMTNSSATSTPEGEVDNLLQMIADENGMELASELGDAGKVGTTVPKVNEPEQKEGDDLQARLAALRR